MGKIAAFFSGMPITAYLIAGLLVVIAFMGYELNSTKRELAETQLAIANQKIEANRILGKADERTRDAEDNLRKFKETQDILDREQSKIILDLSTRLNGISDNAGRLRDPNAKGCRPGSSAPASAGTGAARTGAANPAPAAGVLSGQPVAVLQRPAVDPVEEEGLLSAQLSFILKRDSKKADDINNAYTSCRADGEKLRATLAELNKQLAATIQ